MSHDPNVGEPWWRRYRDLVRRHPADEVADEIRFHLEMREEEARHAGLADEAAREEAHRRFGDVARVATELHGIQGAREQRRRRATWLGDLRGDVRFALRALRRAPAFTAAAVLTLAVAIGATTAIFSVVQALLLRPLPYARPRELVTVWGSRTGELSAFREQLRAVGGLAAYRSRSASLNTEGAVAERIDGTAATPNLFTTLGAAAQYGRSFAAEEGERGRGDVIVLSHGLWRRRFAGDPAVVGRRILLDGVPTTVVGVMPASFAFPSERTQFWTPAVVDQSDVVGTWAVGGYTLIGRLRPGVSLEAAAREVGRVAPTLRRSNPMWDPGAEYGAGATVTSLHEATVASAQPALVLLSGCVLLVLAVACVNVANLLLARATVRERELAVRTALGGGRGRLVRQLLAESMVLAGAGAALGLMIAVVGLHWLVGLLPPDVPRTGEIGVNGPVLLFVAGLAVLTGIAFGLLPALRATNGRSGAEVVRAGRLGRGPGHHRASAALVIGEVAFAVLLVSSAQLLVQSFRELRRLDPGWRTEHVVTARVTPPRADYREPARVNAFYDAVLQRAAALPDVEQVGAVSSLPVARPIAGIALRIQGRFEDMTHTLPTADHFQLVTSGYLRTMRIPVLGGRGFTDADREGAPPVAIVSESAARQFWPGQSAVGKQIGYPFPSPWLTVVGVVPDVKQDSLRDTTRLSVYVPFRQRGAMAGSELTIVARTRGEASAAAQLLRAIIAEVDPAVPVSEVRTMDDVVAQSLAKPRLMMLLVSAFALVALLLGALGVYGVMSYLVTQRAHEIGVRLALGATARGVLVMIVRRATWLAGAGAVLGVASALLLGPALRPLLYGVTPGEPATLLGVPLLFLSVAVLASAAPARRATRVDPATALRAE